MRRWWSVFDLAGKEDAISVMEREAAELGYWDDHQAAQRKMQQLGRLKDTVALWRDLESSSQNLMELTELALAEDDSSLQEQLEAESEDLAQALNCDLVSICEIGELSFDVVINCSPVGMHPNTGETPLSSRYLKAGIVVFDSVYNPPETRLIREARQAGCTVIPGTELFLNQAAAQFELWTDGKAPLDAMREVLMERIRNK